MRNYFRKILSFLLVFSLLLPSVAMGDGLVSSGDISIHYGELDKGDRLKENILEEYYRENSNKELEKLSERLEGEENRKLRVIVELEDRPVLETAMARGLKLGELDPRLRASEEKRVLDGQSNIKTNLKSQGIEPDYLGNYTTVLNGFSMMVDSDSIEDIENTRGVKRVELSNEYERPDSDLTIDMEFSNDMVGSSVSWKTGYDGEGMVIAVLDTGADPNHKDFVISEGKKMALDRARVESIIRENKLEGSYFNEKVPYGYNYYDRSNKVIYDDGGSQHGMHVSGTVAANGDTSKGGIKGVAPEAQILSMKVFSNDISYATTFTDIYLEAIDDAISLGADALNMSLGSPAGTHIESSIEHEALSRAERAGIINTISSGNSRNISYGSSNFYNDFKIHDYNPDIGVVGSPSISRAALTVASADNIKIKADYMTSLPPIVGKEKMILNESGKSPFSSLNDEKGYDYIEAGIGSKEDFAKLGDRVKGKVALVKRGNPFVETVENAEAAGALGCIVYNHEAGGEDLVNMQGSDKAKIPFAFTTNSNGRALVDKASSLKLVFPKEKGSFENETGGLISDFSSWGSGPNLDLKPEITGPGGQIVSTQNNDGYTSMSGTSMSAPHLAGGSVLVKDFVNKSSEFAGLSNKDKSILTRNLLMNTASIIRQKNGVPYSPRLQGAGMMDLDKGTKNKVTVLDGGNNPSKGRAKLELGEVKDNKLNIELSLKNYGSQGLEYRVDGLVLEQLIVDGKLTEEFGVLTKKDNITSLKLAGGEEKSIGFSLDVSKAKEEQYVDGFIELKELTGRGKDLVVPFLAFKGDWNKPRAIDSFDATMLVGGKKLPELISSKGKESQYKYSAFVNEVTSKNNEKSTLVMSPDNLYYSLLEDASQTSTIVPYISQLRNTRFTDYMILDKEGKLLRRIGRDSYPRKAHSMNRGSAPVKVASKGRWDGRIGSGLARDGKYIYRIQSSMLYGNGIQNDDFDLTVDSVAPVLHKLDQGEYYKYDGKGKLELRASDVIGEGLSIDEVSKLKGIAVVNTRTGASSVVELKDKKLGVTPVDTNKDIYDIVIDLKEYMSKGDIDLFISPIDNAGNLSDKGIFIDNREDKGHILIESPDFLEVVGSDDEDVRKSGRLDVKIKGVVYGWNKNGERDTIEDIFINGEKADIGYINDYEVKLDGKTISYKGPAYSFEHKLSLAGGYQGVKIVAKSSKDSAGNQRELAITRYILVDLDLPVLEVNLLGYNEDEARVELRAKDNLSSLSISRNGSLLKDTGDVNSMMKDPSSLSYTDRVKLDRGLNELRYRAKDSRYSVDKVVRIYNNPKALSTDRLFKLLERVDKLNRDNFHTSYLEELDRLYEDIRLLLKKDSPSQEELDRLTSSLEALVSKLESMVDVSKLKLEIEKARKIDLSNYTEETGDKLTEAILKGELILKDESVDQATVDKALKAIKQGVERLKLKNQINKPGLPTTGMSYRKGYISGYGDRTFRPNETISREEVATMFYRAMEMSGKASHNFKDIEPGRWSEEYIARLYMEGVLQGDRGVFRPTDSMTRAEFSTMIYNYLGLKDTNISIFTDVEGHWSKAIVNAVAKEGYIKGYGGNKFRPEQAITRAEAVAIINRVLGIKINASSIPKDIETFKDLDKTAWYYNDVLISSIDHYYIIKNGEYTWINRK